MKKLYTHNLSSAYSRWSNITKVFVHCLTGLPMFLFAVLIPAICAGQQTGDLDLTFSGDGKQTTNFESSTDIGYSVAIQADGKIVVEGSSRNGTNSDFAIVRHNSNGSLDNSFSGDGIQTTNKLYEWEICKI